jgi:DNA-binding transcriptional ArsR family regulator
LRILDDMDAVFVAVADPTRRVLLDRLRSGGAQSISELTRGLPITRQAVTKHLAALTAAGLVRGRKVGRERRHELDPLPLRELDTWLEPYAKAWDRRLVALKQYLEDDDA